MRFERSRQLSKYPITVFIFGAALIISACGAKGENQPDPAAVSTTAASAVSGKTEYSAETGSSESSTEDGVEYIRDSSGNIISEITRGQDGRPVLNNRGFYKGLYAYDNDGNLLTEAYYDTDENLVNTSDGYARTVYAYHRDGSGKYHIVKEDRFAADGSRADIPGDYSYRRDEWDGNRILSTSFYGANDQLTCPKGGFAQLLYEYQDNYSSIIITKKYYDEEGSSLIGPEGGAFVVSEYTSNIYPVNASSGMFDEITRDDLPAEEMEDDSNAWSATDVSIDDFLDTESYNAHRLIRQTIYGTEYERVEGAGGWHIVQNTIGSNGELLRTVYLDPAWQNVLCSDGYASAVYSYDESGRVIKAEYFDQEENLIEQNAGTAMIAFEYSESRNASQISGLELTSSNVSSGADYYVIRRDQDKKGRTIREIYLNSRQKPVLCTQGYAYQINTLNDRGKTIRSDYFDEKEKPIKTVNGYASVSYIYDDEGNKESESYFDTDGNPTWCNYGYHKITFTYDEHGHCTEEHLYNIYNEPAVHSLGMYSSLVRKYNRAGKVRSIKYYGITGGPGLYQGCYAEEHHSYDENGLETEVSYTGLDGNPAHCRGGYAKKLTTYNDQGNITEEAYLDKEGNPVNTSMGYASVSYKYDESENLLSVHYYDADHKNILSDSTSYAYYEIERDDEGRLTSLEYYDDSGELVNGSEGYASYHVSYAPGGRVSEEYYQDQDGKPVAIKEGYSRRTLVSEDALEGTYEMRVTDESGSDKQDYEYALIKYDNQDRAIEHRYFTENDQPAKGPDGCFMTISSYSTNGDMVRVFYFDSNEEQTAVKGVYGIQREYTANGRLDRETWLGKKGKPAINQDGYAVLQYDYELNESESIEKEYRYYQDAYGNPVEASDGSYGISIIRYLNTNVCETRYLGADGEAVNASLGFSLYKTEQDDNGNIIRESYFDASGARTEGPEGYATVERDYDAENRVISERYLDHYNKLTNNADGIAGWKGSYGTDGELVIDSQYDKDLKPIEQN